MSEIISVTGNLAADPERRTTGGGDTVVSFRVGSTQRRFDKDSGTWVDAYTNWFHVSAFRALAEHCLRSLRRGDRVIVTGTLRLRSWENDTRSGMTADIDAHAVGPDLRWGTTVFTRSARSREADDAAAGGESSRAAVDADGWAVPGGEGDQASGSGGAEVAPARERTEREAGREPALAAAGGAAEGEPTPF
ncbi:single-stranded DNA-binding protein [Microbacterium sp. zg.Y1090]|uniref:single-stranded DNA-binding protein n=1 Tax=Microbacterium wangruii TaxID=3049073 RepID=UPI00214D2731|nr:MULTISPECIES: single-stranded DNA-binding protein [unclassified Microbacterium]MCR2818882.1 single-stranded DNA-binding protein [Microbacterium sp. zg.Y1090]MDL5486973.1 single-stranded DNA-binding protein [Microbacterium sp. zg-Y1211]WIM27194.1 single-stranded DNA-binding protein [Microbacterium sp. zg-Y1090]